MTEHHNPVIKAQREFRAHGFPTDPTPENLEQRYAENPALEKIDRFALLIPVVENVVQRMITHSPEPSPTATDFGSLKIEAQAAFNRAIGEYRRDNPFDASDPLSMVVQRREGESGVHSLIKNGSTTAVESMNALLFRLPFVYANSYEQKAEDPTQLLHVARKNYDIVMDHASLHLLDLKREQNISFNTVFSYLQLDERGKASISPAIHKHFPTLFDSNGQVILGEYDTPRLRCPAMYSDALWSVWNWHLKGAERIYTRDIDKMFLSQDVIFPRSEAAAD